MQDDYVSATRHPWPCFLFLLPLLGLYEGGVVSLGGRQPEAIRNGADNWLREGLSALGLRQHYWLPAVLVVIFAAWSYWQRASRPKDLVGVLSGMGIESVAFALGLWALSRALVPLLDPFESEMAVPSSTGRALGQVVTFIGAGIWEETIFRLLLFSGLMWFFKHAEVPVVFAAGISALASATLFSLAHHVGPQGEPFEGYVFLFRVFAGIYFALLYHLRGFGVAVGAHACYDVIVGVMVG